MPHGIFNGIVSDAIRNSQAHVDLVEICRKTKELQTVIQNYLDKYEDRDLSAELLPAVEAQLTPEQAVDYLEQMEVIIDNFDHDAFCDLNGFHWALNTFESLVSGQIYSDAIDAMDAVMAATHEESGSEDPLCVMA